MRKIEVRKILVPTDFSRGAENALEWAKGLAQLFGAQITLLHVVDTTAAAVAGLPMDVYSAPVTGELYDRIRKEGEAALKAIKPSPEITQRLIQDGHPREVVTDVATQIKADLIVMGTHGRRGVSHLFFGSVAEHVVRMAPVPVLTVRAP